LRECGWNSHPGYPDDNDEDFDESRSADMNDD
jgi:hypothetical protein